VTEIKYEVRNILILAIELREGAQYVSFVYTKNLSSYPIKTEESIRTATRTTTNKKSKRGVY